MMDITERKPAQAAANPSSGPAQTTTSPWSPFRHALFTVMWTATVIANIGSWISSAASGWLMTTLNPDPFIAPTTVELGKEALPTLSR